MGIKVIKEETEIIFKDENQLSYLDTGNPSVRLFVDEKYQGNAKVYLDREMDDREYICINYTIIYLDTIKKVFHELN
jgi:hypothetical protein